jgi:opacity protein-like surface antigen
MYQPIFDFGRWGVISISRNFTWKARIVCVFFMLFLSPKMFGDLSGQQAFGETALNEDLPDRVRVYGGYQFLFGLDAKIRLDGDNTGSGSTTDLVDDLGVDDDDSMIRAGASFRFNENHAIGFSWYDINLSGSETIDESLQIDDNIFTGGGQVNSKVDLTLYLLHYNWSFYHSDDLEMTLSPGVYLGDFQAKFKGNAVIDTADPVPVIQERTVKEDFFAPLPTVGLGVQYHLLPRLTANIRADFFYVDINDVQGGMVDILAGLEYRVFKHFAVGIAYNWLMLDLENESGKSDGWEFDGSWNSSLFYGALYF